MFDIPITRSSSKPTLGVPSNSVAEDFGGPKGGQMRGGGDSGIGGGVGDAGRVGEGRVEKNSIGLDGQEDDNAGLAQGGKEKIGEKGGAVEKDLARDKNR